MTGAGEQDRPAHGLAERVWARDTALWTEDPAAAKEVAERLGWLHLPTTMWEQLPRLRGFAAAVRADGVERVLVCGMGGSSLCVEVLAQVLGTGPGGLPVRVLDSTHPAEVADAAAWAPPERSLYVIASKSGTTVEPNDHAAFLEDRAVAALGAGAGRRFAAITDPGTPLVARARTFGYREVFENPPDIGGRYSALSLFGLVPAALLGADLGTLLTRAKAMASACGPGTPEEHNPGTALGRFLAEQARAGRDKVTLLTPPALASFGLWVEQLLAESTGKDGKGLLPVVGEPLTPVAAFGPDRAVVAVGLGEHLVEAGALARAGHPVLELVLSDPLDVGAEFFRWEFATAVAGHLLGVNPFDQPDVQAAKDATRRALADLRAGEAPPPAGVRVAGERDVPGVAAALRDLLAGVKPGEYVALLAYLQPGGARQAELARIAAVIRDATQAATTVGFGPRYLHSTGQLHKGGLPGRFIQLTESPAADLEVPGRGYTFGQLLAAQAQGDREALQARGRRVLHLHVAGAEVLPLVREAAAVALGARDGAGGG